MWAPILINLGEIQKISAALDVSNLLRSLNTPPGSVSFRYMLFSLGFFK